MDNPHPLPARRMVKKCAHTLGKERFRTSRFLSSSFDKLVDFTHEEKEGLVWEAVCRRGGGRWG